MEEAVECEVEVEALAKRSIGPGRRHGVAVREREPFNRSVERASVVVGDRETAIGRHRELEAVQVDQPVMCRTDEYEIASSVAPSDGSSPFSQTFSGSGGMA